MNADRPTLDQLRAVVQKGRHREIGNVLARRLARPSAVYGTWAAARAGVTAHQVTAVALACGLMGAAGIATGTRWGFVGGVAAGWLAFWLDHVDGQVARWRGEASLDGVYLDYLMHHVQNMAVGFALGFGLAVRTGDVAWAAAGFSIALGWAVLGLHNDCRYKAFIQRLKSTTQRYRVDGGAGGRPAPAPGWPHKGLGTLTYPAFKACEPHVVLLGTTALSAAAAFSPAAWEGCWKVGTSVMAVLAPSLAAARAHRSILRGSVEAEFQAWFRPISTPDDVGSTPRPLDDGPPGVVSKNAVNRRVDAA